MRLACAWDRKRRQFSEVTSFAIFGPFNGFRVFWDSVVVFVILWQGWFLKHGKWAG
jgi:hypothetical protein